MAYRSDRTTKGPRRFCALTFVVIATVVVCFCQSLSPLAARAEIAEEYEVKAAFLYNFAKFVEWPPSSFHDPNDRLFLCILGSDPFGTALDSIVSGKTVQQRALAVRRVSDLEGARQCHILFIGGSVAWRVPTVLTALRNTHVLTIGEASDFSARGGIITFLVSGNKVRFEINADAADRAGLQISSQLLKLATNVITTRGVDHGQ